jgi:TrkA-C domain
VIAVGSVLLFVLIGLLITRVATVALRATGMSHEAARFQARSAFSGVGFATQESEEVVQHAVRRNIVLLLMMLSTAGLVTTIVTLMLSFVATSGFAQPALRLAVLACGLVVLWALAASSWVEARLSRVIEWALARWTDLDARDYVRLLDLLDGYAITEVRVDPGEWLLGRRVGDLPLAREGVVVLGITRASGQYMGAPPAGTEFEAGDTLVLYGQADALDELRRRQAGTAGDREHERAKARHSALIQREAAADARHVREARHVPIGHAT